MKDGHIHTPFCPHGTDDSFDMYVKKAIEAGLDEISFTEHFPFPKTFKDPVPENDSTIEIEVMDDYINKVNEIKEKYKDEIKINVGSEIDYIEDYEEGVTDLLNQYGPKLEDSLLSVHFLKINDKHYCLDYDSEEFGRLIDLAGSVEALYNIYYETLIKAVKSDLGPYKPKRIGHLNLIRKFNKVYEYDYSKNEKLEELVKLIAENGFELDYNVAGLFKGDCGEVYISGYLAELVKKYNINVVLGSDSHSSEYINKYEIVL